MTNEMVNTQTGEITTGEQLVNETEEFKIYKQVDGKYRKEMKYKRVFTHIPETEEDKKELYKVLNEEEHEKVFTMASSVNTELEIEHVFIQPYESFDEDTGKNNSGATVTIKALDGNYYVTSSKSVYYSVLNMFEAFGYPGTKDYTPIKIKITGTKRTNGTQINISLV